MLLKGKNSTIKSTTMTRSHHIFATKIEISDKKFSFTPVCTITGSLQLTIDLPLLIIVCQVDTPPPCPTPIDITTMKAKLVILMGFFFFGNSFRRGLGSFSFSKAWSVASGGERKLL